MKRYAIPPTEVVLMGDIYWISILYYTETRPRNLSCLQRTIIYVVKNPTITLHGPLPDPARARWTL